MRLTDEELADVIAKLDDPKCHRCNGRGMLPLAFADGMIGCSTCESTGFFSLSLDVSKSALAELRQARAALVLTDEEREALAWTAEEIRFLHWPNATTDRPKAERRPRPARSPAGGVVSALHAFVGPADPLLSDRCTACGSPWYDAIHRAHMPGHAVVDGWQSRCLAAEARLAAVEPLRLLVAEFIRYVSLCRRQRDARGTGGMGSELPGEPLSYIQPSALNELVRTARSMEIALATIDTLAQGGEK